MYGNMETVFIDGALYNLVRNDASIAFFTLTSSSFYSMHSLQLFLPVYITNWLYSVSPCGRLPLLLREKLYNLSRFGESYFSSGGL